MRKKKFIIIMIFCLINILFIKVSYCGYLDGTGTYTTTPYAPGQEIIQKEEQENTSKDEQKTTDKGYISGGSSSAGQQLIEEEKENEETTDILEKLDSFKPSGENSATFDKIVNNIVYVLQVIGSIISVIVLIGIGIKYMYGSLEEKAEYKETMMPYIIGAVMVFTMSNLTGLIYSLAKNVFS